MNLVNFVVVGEGKFPMFMLSKTKCHPKTTEDSALIEESLISITKSKRSIRLIGEQPSDNLWRTLGWSVVSKPLEMKNDYERYHTWPC